MVKIALTCEYCKKIFFDYLCNHPKGKIYCSRVCSHNSQKGKKVIFTNEHRENLGNAIRKNITWVEDKNGCHIVTSHHFDNNGYPSYQYKNKRTRLHRFVYEQKNGAIPKGKIIRHICDNPHCINIHHLIIGTMQDNTNDMISRGRQAVGEKLPKTKITKEQAKEIFNSTKTNTQLAGEYHISRRTIREIKQKLIWKHIHNEVN